MKATRARECSKAGAPGWWEGKGISEQDAVCHTSGQEGQARWELAKLKALIYLSTQLLRLCWTGKVMG